MSASHTPGPWERLQGFAEPGHPSYQAGRSVIRIVQQRAPRQVEFVRVAFVDSDNVWNDARLIAAAPELLANLGFAVKLLSALPGFSGSAQVEAMRAAIAKATA